MKRFHVHVAVDDLAASIAFYRRLFGCAPAVEHSDYAKWMLDDPRVNFAISARGHTAGLNHLGFQAEDDAELAQLEQRAVEAAGTAVVAQQDAGCCYAVSDKYWVVDPQGIAWENFHTLGTIPTFGEDTVSMNKAGTTSCCIPLQRTAEDQQPRATATDAACCVPNRASGLPDQTAGATRGGCC